MRKSAWKQQLPQPISSSDKTRGMHSSRESSWPSLTRPPQQQSSAPSQQQEQQPHEHQPRLTTSGFSRDRQRSVLSPLSSSAAEAEGSHNNNYPRGKANSNDNNRIHHCNKYSNKSNHIRRRNENNYKITSNDSNKKHQSLSSHERQKRYRTLNQELVAAQSVSEVLSVLEQSATLSEVGAGKSLNTVNFSTALHRIARHATATTKSTTVSNKNAPKQQSSPEPQVLSDPRTALLLASIAECMVDPTMAFQAQHLANIAWALAKLQLVPQISELPSALDRNQSHRLLATTAANVRQKVMEVAIERATGTLSKTSSNVAHCWMSALTQLAGYVLDVTGETVLQRVTAAGTVTTQRATSREQQSFEMQNWSNLLWAWAKAGRANEQVFGVVIRTMIQQQSEKIRQQGLSGGIPSPSTKDPPAFTSLPVEQGLLRPQHLSNAVWAVATAQCYGNYDELLVNLAHLLEEYPDFISKFNCQNLSNTLWGIATLLSNKKQLAAGTIDGRSSKAAGVMTEQAALKILRCVFHALVQRRAEGFDTQHLSNSIWAAAKVGFGLTSPTSLVENQQRSNNYVVLKSDQPKLDAKLMVEVVNVLVEASRPQLSRFSSQEISNLAWSLVRLISDDSNRNVVKSSTESMRSNVRSLLEGIGWQLADPRRVVNSHDVAITLWALATLEFYDRDVYRGIASRLSPDQAHLYKPQELSYTVWAFATAEAEVEDIGAFDTSFVSGMQHPMTSMDPVSICFAIAANELIRRPQQFKPQDVKDILWAFSKIGIRHPILFKSVAEHLAGSEDGSITARGVDEFLSNHLSKLVWAYARQAQLAQSTSDRLYLNGRLIVPKTICSDIGEQLLQRLFLSIATTFIHVHDGMPKANPQDISTTAWAFAVLGLKDTMFVCGGHKSRSR